MFQVKATVIGFKGDEERYPCHFQHKVGDEFIWDGEKFIGRICPYLAGDAVNQMLTLAKTGPRKVNPSYFLSFWYAPTSRKDPSKKKYDGLGFCNVLGPDEGAPAHLPQFMPPGVFTWPPPTDRCHGMGGVITCGDIRTMVAMRLQAFDLSDKGDSIPYFRREMSILHKVLAKPGIAVNKLLAEFSKDEIEIPYPALGEVIIDMFCEELEVIGYLAITEGKATVTEAGKNRLAAFKKTLSAEERQALHM